MAKLTKLEKAAAQQIFAEGKACPDCGGVHQRACPRIQSQEWHPNGNRVSVTYFKRYDDTGVVWPEDAYDPEDTEAASG